MEYLLFCIKNLICPSVFFLPSLFCEHIEAYSFCGYIEAYSQRAAFLLHLLLNPLRHFLGRQQSAAQSFLAELLNFLVAIGENGHYSGKCPWAFIG